MENKLSKEFTELVNEMFGKVHEGEPWHTRIAHAGKELADVVAVVFDAVDEENQVAELAAFRRDVQNIIQDAIDKADVKPPRFVAMLLPAIVKSGVDWGVEEIVESGQSADAWAKQTLVPILKELDELIIHWTLRLTRGGEWK